MSRPILLKITLPGDFLEKIHKRVEDAVKDPAEGELYELAAILADHAEELTELLADAHELSEGHIYQEPYEAVDAWYQEEFADLIAQAKAEGVWKEDVWTC